MANQNKNYIRIDNKSEKIQRIFEKRWLLELIKNKKSSIPRISTWDDPYENFFLKSTVITESGERGSLGAIEKAWFGQCWSFGDESDAMWRIYSNINNDGNAAENESIGIKVITSVEKLLEAHKYNPQKNDYVGIETFIGKVDYVEEKEISKLMEKVSFTEVAFGGQNDKFADLICLKRKPFQHENECRILFNDTNDRFVTSNRAEFDINPNEFIDKIILDPRTCKKLENEIIYEIVAAGFNGDITKSSLYDIPSYTIKL